MTGMSISPEQGLVLRARQGDTAAFSGLVQSHQAGVFNVCYRLLGDRHEAEDLAQEAFLRAYQRLHTFNPDLPFGPWMRRVAANACLNHLEKKRAALFSFDEERDDPPDTRQPGPEAALRQAELHGELRAALLALPPAYRVVIELRHYQELSYEEIAASLSIPLSDVKSHLFRARKMLAEKLKAYET
jgi:RNA polymerase sigma-70 factor (ECF subfamily)